MEDRRVEDLGRDFICLNGGIMKTSDSKSMIGRWMCAALVALGLPIVANAQTADFASVAMVNLAAGQEGYVNATSFTDPTSGITAAGYSSATRQGTYSPANLYRRNVPDDHGIGVCSEGQSACDSGGGDVNELDNAGTWEIIALTRPASHEWVSVQVSSLDANIPPGGAVEMGKLWAAGDATNPGTWTLIQNLTGNDLVREPTISIPEANKSANFLVFEPVNDAGVETDRNNDFLVYQATVEMPILDCPGTGTIGYWKNHPEAWPVDSITIGGVVYTKAQAIAIMQTPVAGDKTRSMFSQLVAAKLNGGIGCGCGTIGGTIAAADAWMAAYGPVGSGVAGNSAAWRLGGTLHGTLDDYNNGNLCAPHRD